MSQTPKIIVDFVQKFECNIHQYDNPKSNEALIRVDFVKPFWKTLNWDADNGKGYVTITDLPACVSAPRTHLRLYGLAEKEIRIVEGVLETELFLTQQSRNQNRTRMTRMARIKYLLGLLQII